MYSVTSRTFSSIDSFDGLCPSPAYQKYSGISTDAPELSITSRICDVEHADAALP